MGKPQLRVDNCLKSGGDSGPPAEREGIGLGRRLISPIPAGRPTAGKQEQAQATAGGTRAELIAETRAGTERTLNPGIGLIPKGRRVKRQNEGKMLGQIFDANFRFPPARLGEGLVGPDPAPAGPLTPAVRRGRCDRRHDQHDQGGDSARHKSRTVTAVTRGREQPDATGRGVTALGPAGDMTQELQGRGPGLLIPLPSRAPRPAE